MNLRGLILGSAFSAVQVFPVQLPLWWRSNPWVQDSVCKCYPKIHPRYTLVWVLSLPLMGVSACASCAVRTGWRAAAKALTFPSAVSGCFWEENVPLLCVRCFWLPSHTLTRRHTLLTSTGHLISGRKFMGHSESENLTDFSFSTLPS